MLVLLIVLVVIGNTLLSPFFLRTNNLMRAASDFVELGLMMLPMVFVIITVSIDLSVASILGFTASFMGWLFNAGWNIWAAAAAALVLGAAAGAVNGILIACVRLPSLVVTLGTYAFYRGWHTLCSVMTLPAVIRILSYSSGKGGCSISGFPFRLFYWRFWR